MVSVPPDLNVPRRASHRMPSAALRPGVLGPRAGALTHCSFSFSSPISWNSVRTLSLMCRDARNSASLNRMASRPSFSSRIDSARLDGRLMGRGELPEQIEIDPVGALVRLGIRVHGHIDPGDGPGHRLRQIFHLVIPLVAPDVHGQIVTPVSRLPCRSPSRLRAPCPSR